MPKHSHNEMWKMKENLQGQQNDLLIQNKHIKNMKTLYEKTFLKYS